MHLRDMLEVGFINATWCDQFPATLAERLRQLIDMPEGSRGRRRRFDAR